MYHITRKAQSVFCYLLPVTCYLFFLAPAVASAQYTITIFDTPSEDLNFTVFANKLVGIANAVIPFLIGVAFVVILWGIFKYIRNAGDSEKVAEGRKAVVYGVIALFLMLSFWGFVMLITKSLGLTQ